MDLAENRSPAGLFRAALFFGGVWGIIEAMLGFVLHFIPTVTPLPSLSGALLFPLGFLFMYGAFRLTGRSASILLCAVVAAAVKLASLVLPMVTFPFVRNPALAILLEGLATFVVVGLFAMEPDRLLAPKALALSVSWRALYLGALLALGIKGGILAKGTPALLSFLILESAANGVLIWCLVSFRVPDRILRTGSRGMPLRTVGVAVVFVTAVGTQLLFSLL